MPQAMISARERAAFYKTLFGRRDVRAYFKPDPIPFKVLGRILKAAHHAGSVGFMQPWNFILIDDPEVKRKVHASFLKERREAAQLFDRARRKKYLSYKLEGILEAPVNLCVTCDYQRHGPQGIGRRSMPETALYSTVCAVQNLWLAARAENVGVGWVSIIKPSEVQRILRIPRGVSIVAYLCLGYVTQFPAKPDLETLGWQKRDLLAPLVFFNRWKGRPAKGWQAFKKYL